MTGCAVDLSPCDIFPSGKGGWMDAAPGDVPDQLEMVRRDKSVESLGFGTFLFTISVPTTGLQQLGSCPARGEGGNHG